MRTKPEILAPAGDEAALKAALAAGADAVYFGLDEGFNARARARNFPLDELSATVARIHRAGARAYVTMNTLVFEPELSHAERVLRGIAASGVDAIIVQDPAIALLAKELGIEVHASTQMTIASPGAAAFAKDLGVNRVVVPRELSVDEIRRFAAGTDLQLEVFVHGALCMSWSGQCLTSEAWGGRSANRGQCAQSCRLPYDLIVDGVRKELGEVRYLLSPRDLAGAPVIADLMEAGVVSLKIEGRQKGPAYVGSSVGGYRHLVDALAAGTDRAVAEQAMDADLRAMALSYSRGFSAGFLRGSDHQTLVDGRFPKHRGLFVGRVLAVNGDDVVVDADADVELRAGMGVVFDAGDPEDKAEPGGPLFRVDRRGDFSASGGGREGSSAAPASAETWRSPPTLGAAPRPKRPPPGSRPSVGDSWTLGFGRPGPDLGRVRPGQRVWATSDPAIARAVERASEREPEGRHAIDLVVSGVAGSPLTVVATTGSYVAMAHSESRLAPARAGGLGAELLADKLGALGGTAFRLAALQADVAPGLHVPVSELKAMRRTLVAELLAQVERGPVRSIAASGAVERVRASLPLVDGVDADPVVVPLCRTDAQLEAAIDVGSPEVELDWMELVGLGKAVARAREAGLRVTVATLRVTKPGEEQFDERLVRLEPDAILVRHWAALERLRGAGIPLHGDFSLNVTNGITSRLLLGRGLSTVTASFDLDEAQLDALVAVTPPSRLVVMVYHRIPTFHTEHCVYAAHLSKGRDFRSCGRPCESHQIGLRDEKGQEHPVVVDAGCRNTVFNHRTQSAAGAVPGLLRAGVRRFRVQLVRETRAEAAAVLRAHRDLVLGKTAPAELIARFALAPQLGVSEAMATIV